MRRASFPLRDELGRDRPDQGYSTSPTTPAQAGGPEANYEFVARIFHSNNGQRDFEVWLDTPPPTGFCWEARYT